MTGRFITLREPIVTAAAVSAVLVPANKSGVFKITDLCSRILLECLLKVIREQDCFYMRNIRSHLIVYFFSVRGG